MTDAFNGTFPVTEIESAVDVDAIILGAPFEDNAPTYQKGAAIAPSKIREVSQLFSGQSFETTSIHASGAVSKKRGIMNKSKLKDSITPEL